MESASVRNHTDLPQEVVGREEVSSSLPKHCMVIHMAEYLFKEGLLLNVPLVLEEVSQLLYYSIHFTQLNSSVTDDVRVITTTMMLPTTCNDDNDDDDTDVDDADGQGTFDDHNSEN